MKVGESVALVTCANRGLGRAFARELVSRGATKVYGAGVLLDLRSRRLTAGWHTWSGGALAHPRLSR
jgi:NAD(P)-dependent dehydrogenase (short-subunit alcohol dehydrogenase family)